MFAEGSRSRTHIQRRVNTDNVLMSSFTSANSQSTKSQTGVYCQAYQGTHRGSRDPSSEIKYSSNAATAPLFRVEEFPNRAFQLTVTGRKFCCASFFRALVWHNRSQRPVVSGATLVLLIYGAQNSLQYFTIFLSDVHSVYLDLHFGPRGVLHPRRRYPPLAPQATSLMLNFTQ